jgi:hypothetical protein
MQGQPIQPEKNLYTGPFIPNDSYDLVSKELGERRLPPSNNLDRTAWAKSIIDFCARGVNHDLVMLEDVVYNESIDQKYVLFTWEDHEPKDESDFRYIEIDVEPKSIECEDLADAVLDAYRTLTKLRPVSVKEACEYAMRLN